MQCGNRGNSQVEGWAIVLSALVALRCRRTSMPARRGRPPIDPTDPSVGLNIRLPSKDYDRLYALAREQRVGVPELARRGLRLLLKTAGRDPGE